MKISQRVKRQQAYAAILKAELESSFNEHINYTVQEQGTISFELLAKLKYWYNGYLFSPQASNRYVYNPFSILLFFQNQEFKNYWFETGTPTFLLSLIKENNYPIFQIYSVLVSDTDLSSFDIERIKLPALLFQTGYLTIESRLREHELSA